MALLFRILNSVYATLQILNQISIQNVFSLTGRFNYKLDSRHMQTESEDF